MKRTQKLSWLFAFVLLFGSNTQLFSQTIKDFFADKGTELTYLGIDYYQNRLINNAGISASEMKSRYYTGMNEVVVNEMEKNYKIGEAFSRDGSVSVDIAAVTARNEKADVKDIESSKEGDFNRLTEADIASEVKALNLGDKSGIGLVFIMEGMRKDEKKGYGSVWATLIDMKTKSVLITERMEQEAAGFSIRNYWVSVIKKSIVEIDKKAYKSWKKKYGG